MRELRALGGLALLALPLRRALPSGRGTMPLRRPLASLRGFLSSALPLRLPLLALRLALSLDRRLMLAHAGRLWPFVLGRSPLLVSVRSGASRLLLIWGRPSSGVGSTPT